MTIDKNSYGVEVRTRTVYFSPRRRRHFLTAFAAARAEANARIKRFFPAEDGERDEYGRETYPGFHFTEEPRLVAVRDRLIARYMKRIGGST